MIRVVLIDDEPQSCKALAIKLKALANDLEIVAVYHDPLKALEGLSKNKPDLLFLDIEMPGMNGFQLLESMENFSFEVIFITAYDEYTLNALRVSALDYLLKPVDTTELENSLTRLRNRMKVKQNDNTMDVRNQLEILRDSMQMPHGPKRLAITTLQGIVFLKFNEIIRVEAVSNYSTFYLVNKQKIVVSKTLKEYELILTSQNFFRVSRSCIVNTDYVVKYRNEDGGVLLLQDGSEVGVGPNRKNELVELLSGL
ncbi:MAG TPA: LytTR family DNA-binding domain-containing protein [Chitinophagaceae bacterium]